MLTILVVEDDSQLNLIICDYLKAEGYEVLSCNNGKTALEIFSNKVDIIISDVMMPVMDGNALVKKVREISPLTPVIFITAKDDMLSKKIAYKSGVDDYIVKPFDIDELILKVKAFERRIVGFSKIISIGNLSINTDEHTCHVNGEEISLTVREFDLLHKFALNPKRTFTRSYLMEEFWDFDSSATSRTVDVYIARLREKMAKCDAFEIVTVHGLGYKAVINEKE